MKMSSLIVGGLLLSVVFLVCYGMLADLGGSGVYDVSIDDNYKDSYNKLTELNNLTVTVQHNIENITAEKDKGFFTGVWDVFNIGKSAVFGVGVLGFGAVDVVTDMSTATVDSVGVGYSEYIKPFFMAVITVGVIGLLVTLIIGRDW